MLDIFTESSEAGPSRRPIARMTSASTVVATSSLVSPLTQVKHGLVDMSGQPSSSVASRRPNAIPPIGLDFNLFRSNSRYSVDSITSLESTSTFDSDTSDLRELERQWAMSTSERDKPWMDNGGERTPTTPRAPPEIASQVQSAPSKNGGGGYFDLGPVVSPSKSLHPSPPRDGQSTPTKSSSHVSPPNFSRPWRSNSSSSSGSYDAHKISPPGTGPYALHHAYPNLPHRTSSPRIPHVVPHGQTRVDDIAEMASIHGEQGSDWGEDEAQFEWLDSSQLPEAINGDNSVSPSRRLTSKLKSKVPLYGESTGRKLKKQLVLPRRAAPPPPPGPGSPPPTSFIQEPTLVPLKDGDSSLNKQPPDPARNSTMSFQSVAYSIYDLDGSNTPKPVSGESVFPHGKYTKVSARDLNERVERVRGDSQSTVHPDSMAITPEDFVRKGLEARGKGDLPKSAWYFMQAAENGSSSGRMYWGLALRHGWGIAKDEKRALAELRHACDDSMAQGGLDFHTTPTAAKLTSVQKKSMNEELSLGLFEVGNCFLNGVGVKKAPDVAISYLRFAANLGDIASQEQLGFLLSKGTSGVKKDMKEAARWYRMAIGQGSTNTFGLAWIWKEKYMD